MRTLFISLLGLLLLPALSARATNNYEYGADEYVTIGYGIAPDGKYAITAHGGGELGYDNFHIYLTDAVTGKKVGPLEEIVDPLDTGASAFAAHWSADSTQVSIVYRIDRHEPLKVVTYRLGKGRAFLLKGPVNATEKQMEVWSKESQDDKPSPRTFGTPKNG